MCFCMPEGSIPAPEIRAWNSKHVGLAYIVSSGTQSHFMQSNTLLEVFDQCYSAAVKLQRNKFLGVRTLEFRMSIALSMWHGSTCGMN